MAMNITEERDSWHNLKGLFEKAHVHKFEQAMSADTANDDVYYYGRCACGETDV